MNKTLSCLALAAVLTLPMSASAYVLGPTAPGKWGDPTPGSGATVTWSLMGGGVSCTLEYLGCTTTGLDAFLPGGYLTEIEHAFEAWSAVANIRFVQVADDGAAFDSRTNSGDIRIGAHIIDGPWNLLAYSYFPPLNGLSLAGDIFLDVSDTWKLGFGGAGYDLFQALTHEIGHAIGLDHTADPAALMSPRYTEAFRGLQPDDIAGARFLYGAVVTPPPPMPTPEPATLALVGAGLLGLGLQRRKARRRTGCALAVAPAPAAPSAVRLNTP